MRVLRIRDGKYVELNAVGSYIDRVEAISRPIVRNEKKWVPLQLVIDAVRDAADAAARARNAGEARRAFELLERLEATTDCQFVLR